TPTSTAPVTQKSRVCFSSSVAVGASATSAPTRACSSARMLLSVISPAQPAVILGDIVAVLARVVDGFRGPGGIGSLRGAGGLQRRQLQLVHQRRHALVLHVHRVRAAATQPVGQLLQRAGISLVEHATAQLFTQLREPLGRHHRLVAQARSDRRVRLAIAAAVEADIAADPIAAAARAAVVGAAVGAGLGSALLAGRVALFPALAFATLSLLTLLAATLLAVLALARIRRGLAGIPAGAVLRQSLLAFAVDHAPQVAQFRQQIFGGGLLRLLLATPGF